MPNSGKIATILGNVLTDSQIDLSTKADLVDGKIPSSQLPSYVDDILEYANLAAFPATGSSGIIYVAQDTNKIYRWTGSAYAEVSPTVGTTWGTITGTLSNQTDLQTALDAKVPTSRTLTINGTALDLSANRSFTVGDVRTDSTYANPAWITSLAWSKITSTPTTISGYGITNAYTDAQIQNFFNGANAISGYNKTNWDTAYGWGNHAVAGYVTLTGNQTITGEKIFNSTNLFRKGISTSVSTTAYSSYSQTGLAVVGQDSILEMFGIDDDTTWRHMLTFKNINPTTGNLVSGFGFGTHMNTGNAGSNTFDRLALSHGTDVYPQGNTDIMSWKPSGKIGIGEIDPQLALHIKRDEAGTGLVRLQNTSATGYTNFQFYNNSGTFRGSFGYINTPVATIGAIGQKFLWDLSGTDAMIRGGNVAVGGSAAVSKFHIFYTDGSYGSDSTSGFINEATTGRATQRVRSITDNPSEIFFDVNGAARWDISARDSSSSYDLMFFPQAASPAYNSVGNWLMKLSQDGRVTVQNLTTGDGVGGIRIDRSATDREANLQFSTAGSNKWWFQLDNDSTHNFYLFKDAGGSEFLQTWTSTGLVGIGKTPSTKLDVNGITSIRGGDVSTDNIRFYNTDGNYAYIRQTPANNVNNIWFDPALGATLWHGWDNPGQARTANTYTDHRFGVGRGTSNESVRIYRGDMQNVDANGNTTWKIIGNGVLGTFSYINYGSFAIGTANTPPTKLFVYDGSLSVQTSPTNHSAHYWYSINGAYNTVRVKDGGSELYIKKELGSGGYGNMVLYSEVVERNFDISFKLTMGTPASSYRHFAIAVPSDGTDNASSYDFIVFRHRVDDTNLNQIRIDVSGTTESDLQSSSVPNWADGTERHILIQVRNNVFFIEVNGVLVREFTISKRSQARGRVGFAIYEGSDANTWCTIRNFELTQYGNDKSSLPLTATRTYSSLSPASITVGSYNYSLAYGWHVRDGVIGSRTQVRSNGGVTAMGRNYADFPVSPGLGGAAEIIIPNRKAFRKVYGYIRVRGGASTDGWTGANGGPSSPISAERFMDGIAITGLDTNNANETWIWGIVCNNYDGAENAGNKPSFVGSNYQTFLTNHATINGLWLTSNDSQGRTPVKTFYFERTLSSDIVGNIRIRIMSDQSPVDNEDVGIEEFAIYVAPETDSNYHNAATYRFLGDLVATGDITAYGSASDIRLKEIKEKVPNALQVVNKLNGYRFDWKEKPGGELDIKEDIGVIAQEVVEVLPELARENQTGYMSVRYQGLTAVLIEAVKELAAENNKLKEILERNNIQ